MPDKEASMSADPGMNDEQSDSVPVTLRWYVAGYMPQADTPLVQKAMSDYVQEKYGLNINLEIICVDFGSYSDKMQIVIASGEEYDICWTSSWCNNYFINVNKNAFVPLDDLIEKYGQELYASIPESVWNGTRINGTLYAVPNYQIEYKQSMVAIPKKYVEEFSLDVSKIKSKWVGESEKSVKGIFQMYKKLCASRPRVPILLFNEADAIFGKRNENPERSVDKMNNAMQNILLQGMEDLDGILIATTNLEGSLDPAFERRFIYKVKFDMPSKEQREKMWKSMIPELDDVQAGLLAKDYTFSGGQIENIARKSAVEYVLSGEEVSLPVLQKFCGEEMLQGKSHRNKIGF